MSDELQREISETLKEIRGILSGIRDELRTRNTDPWFPNFDTEDTTDNSRKRL